MQSIRSALVELASDLDQDANWILIFFVWLVAL